MNTSRKVRDLTAAFGVRTPVVALRLRPASVELPVVVGGVADCPRPDACSGTASVTLGSKR